MLTMKKLLIFFALFASLTGCVPAALVAGAAGGAVGGAIVYDKRGIKTMVSDQNISQQASSKIYNDTELRTQAHIVVTSFNRIVLVVGQAPTAELRDRAIALVQSVPNVRRVYNEITIEPPTSASQRAEDTWITTKAKSEMLARKGLQSTQIKVLTENGVVYLMGVVTPSQGDLAADVVRRVSGVQQVVKLFEYPS